MADAGQHGCALFNLPFYALAHLDECESCTTDFLRAARAEITRHRPALAETFCSFGQFLNRADLVAQKQDRDAEEHQ